ncbi:hypothetical protein HMPREF9439_01702 [Parasutterella excrementihominis YIT 11859]|uniref:Uncharacterized protein n=1 Tax=Parasutterella excrementihominis YIT 11859 TaxID=762966 RepID=F3QL84_9BURK|nr:hypothetical protein HMPREF9439_01702 [Parasutterella excrementihominis YIT 11859]
MFSLRLPSTLVFRFGILRMTHSPAVFDGYSPEAVTQSPLLGLAPGFGLL